MMTEADLRRIDAVRAWRRNEQWQAQVHHAMRDGYGYEDIAVRLDCPLPAVEAERDILRAEGRLDALYRAGRRA